MSVSHTELLNELNKEVTRNNPTDILQFCANFFYRKLEQERESASRGRATTGQDSLSRNAPTEPASAKAGLFTNNSFGSESPTSGRDRTPSPGASSAGPRLETANYTFPTQDSNGASNFDQVNRGTAASFPPSSAPQESYPQNYNANRRTSVSAESMLPSADNTYQKVVIPKTEKQLARIDKSISRNLLFKNLDEEQLQDVLDAMSEKKLSTPGSVIIKQGDVGDFFYVVESGLFEIFVKAANGTDDSGGRGFGKRVAEAKEGGSFGELALMYNAPRAATVVSKSADAVLWALDRITFRRILMENTSRRRKMYEKFLESVHVLNALDLAERQKIADSLDTCVFDKGAIVIRQGDVGEQFFIIESGEADVIKDGEGVIARLGKGDYFGESALINDAPRNATVQAATRLKVATLGKRAFVRLLGPVLDIMKREQHVQ